MLICSSHVYDHKKKEQARCASFCILARQSTSTQYDALPLNPSLSTEAETQTGVSQIQAQSGRCEIGQRLYHYV